MKSSIVGRGSGNELHIVSKLVVSNDNAARCACSDSAAGCMTRSTLRSGYSTWLGGRVPGAALW